MSNDQWSAEQNVILAKSYAFAVRMLKLHKHLRMAQQEHIVSKQVVRSGTSFGANVEEAIGAISKADFSAKMSIAYKEARETSYWLRLLHDAEYLEARMFESLHNDCQELCRILFAILRGNGRA
ncbi:four helix bundle protein [Hymenobacter oligotrophus]|uniref:Four helix bundle protein n=1 Tax=Hymenobacter oligotrophus TaxID=2319843 RepID=A0A3B7QWI1_9BACT|nr:four helix bundle protein [Hymenobacter oligotrophus]AYA35895.1 four helix bundle protein [Hymenobacter oligotrophus]